MMFFISVVAKNIDFMGFLKMNMGAFPVIYLLSVPKSTDNAPFFITVFLLFVKIVYYCTGFSPNAAGLTLIISAGLPPVETLSTRK